MPKTSPSRRRRGTIKRSVLLRLDATQSSRVAMLEQASGRSAAAIILAMVDGSVGLPSIPLPPRFIPAAADASMLCTMRQLGALVAKGLRDRALPAAEAKGALEGLQRAAAAYEEAVHALT